MKLDFDQLLSRIKLDMHIPLAVLVFSVTTLMHWHTGRDLGPNYVNSIYAMYAFLAGHAFTTAKYPDQPDPKP